MILAGLSFSLVTPGRIGEVGRSLYVTSSHPARIIGLVRGQLPVHLLEADTLEVLVYRAGARQIAAVHIDLGWLVGTNCGKAEPVKQSAALGPAAYPLSGQRVLYQLRVELTCDGAENDLLEVVSAVGVTGR